MNPGVAALPALFLLAAALPAQNQTQTQAQSQLVLNRQWAAKNQNRVTLDINLTVDRALATPHPIGKGGDDGDIHFAGRSTDIGLPLVAEIMNANMENPALADLQKVANGVTVPVSGAWRLWFEHPGGVQIQGNPVGVPVDSNPDHVFEIHPVTKFDSIPVADSFQAIPGYQAYDAQTAFSHYQQLTATILATASSLTISTPEAGHNYTHFLMQLAGAPVASDDGGFLVVAKVMEDAEQPILQNPIRMVMAPGTVPAATIGKAAAGGQFHVLGIPRVNLNALLAMAAQQPAGSQFSAQLPYEMIIVGICGSDLTACVLPSRKN